MAEKPVEGIGLHENNLHISKPTTCYLIKEEFRVGGKSIALYDRL